MQGHWSLKTLYPFLDTYTFLDLHSQKRVEFSEQIMVESNGNQLIKLKLILRQNLLAITGCFLPPYHIIGLTLQTFYL